MILFYCLKGIKIALKKGTWKWLNNFTLRLKKVSWVALFPTTDNEVSTLILDTIPKYTFQCMQVC